ncbi:UNVERIFIED_CONTAM: Retrovirus-related Pol polyprotein from transposon TNT 1-94 [Sesamum latifolium]|uniref:Retrovirus-related Pol polyprotein from transposon TNT 1-94 n=1 Tax=Sesamum latifolium TaxID=2727402 RepID=A0AAW2UG55_9LAMI
MAKSIRILLAIAAWYDYETWQMDVKTALLNGFVEEKIFMDQPEGFTAVGEEQKNDYDPCIYKKISGSSIAYLVLYVDDILLNGNDVKMLGNIKAWLSTQFSMKNMGEASYILGIKIYRDRSRRMLSRRKHSVCCPVYQARCRLRFKRNEQIPGKRRGGALGRGGYSAASFQSDDDDAKSQSGLFKLNSGVVAWKSSKQDTTADSTTEAEYIAASEAAKEAVWMKNYIQELSVVPSMSP